jgi:hypothetical protein
VLENAEEYLWTVAAVMLEELISAGPGLQSAWPPSGFVSPSADLHSRAFEAHSMAFPQSNMHVFGEPGASLVSRPYETQSQLTVTGHRVTPSRPNHMHC